MLGSKEGEVPGSPARKRSPAIDVRAPALAAVHLREVRACGGASASAPAQGGVQGRARGRIIRAVRKSRPRVCVRVGPIMSHKCMSKMAVKTSKDTHKSVVGGRGG